MKSSVPTSTTLNSGWRVVTISSIRKTFSLSKMTIKSMDLNQWTVLVIALCSIFTKNHTEIFQSEWLISASSTETNWKELCQDLQESEDSNKMMLTFSVCLNKLKKKFSVFLTSLITFIQFLVLNIKSNCQQDLKSFWVKLKIGNLLSLNLKKLLINLEKNTKSMKEMVLSMVQKLTSNFLILSEDNINAVLANLTSNFQSDSIFNTEPNKWKKKNLNNRRRKKKPKKKKLNWLLNKLNREKNKLLKKRKKKNKSLKKKRNNKKLMKSKKKYASTYIVNILAILYMITATKILIWLPSKKVIFYLILRIQRCGHFEDWICQTSYRSQSYFRIFGKIYCHFMWTNWRKMGFLAFTKTNPTHSNWKRGQIIRWSSLQHFNS